MTCTLSGPASPVWKGGRTVASNGYVLVRRPGHPMADKRGYVYEHRLVASEMLGRPLLRTELVHHLNEIKTDNRPENLAVKASRHAHAVEHRRRPGSERLQMPGEQNVLMSCACGCSTLLLRYDQSGRPRDYVSGHNLHPLERTA